MWNDWSKRTQVVCHARCSSRQFVNSGGTPGEDVRARLRVAQQLDRALDRSEQVLKAPLTHVDPSVSWSQDAAARLVDAPGKQSLLHRVGDVEQVLAHRRLGLVRLPGDDRLDDRGVLGDGCSRASGDQDRPVLVATVGS